MNQVANYRQTTVSHLLSPKVRFEWTPEIDKAFEASKSLIVEAIKDGVEIFQYGRKTCLRTDWSKTGIGYFLQQKHCSCALPKGGLPNCCNGGWCIVLAKSRFLSSAAKNYLAVEGKTLAIAWSLEQTKYFTMGCPDLLVVTDHKPLVRLLGAKPLAGVTNPGPFRLKQPVPMWDLSMAHLPGRTNKAADATSRQPSTGDDQEEEAETLIADAVCCAISMGAGELQTTADTDRNYVRLRVAVEAGFPEWARTEPATARYWGIRNLLYIRQGRPQEAAAESAGASSYRARWRFVDGKVRRGAGVLAGPVQGP